ncbi:hypothetical protein C8Q79DRAFT_1007195 [Trametes meyenii]|nr:hypothetical protein C8Q79DRAFT_1007195 [Trametes meyenii]
MVTLEGPSTKPEDCVNKPSDSSVVHPLESNLARKKRAGTHHFIAIELHYPRTNVPHDLNHDLESFFWVLIWIVLRHTRHIHPYGCSACDTVFVTESDNDTLARGMKLSFAIDIRSVRVLHDGPLSTLLNKFRDLVLESLLLRRGPISDLSWETVLPLFKEAIDSDGWPQSDAAIPYPPPVVTTDERLDMPKGKNN